jgi:flagellar hook-length control protein FliK
MNGTGLERMLPLGGMAGGSLGKDGVDARLGVAWAAAPDTAFDALFKATAAAAASDRQALTVPAGKELPLSALQVRIIGNGTRLITARSGPEVLPADLVTAALPLTVEAWAAPARAAAGPSLPDALSSGSVPGVTGTPAEAVTTGEMAPLSIFAATDRAMTASAAFASSSAATGSEALLPGVSPTAPFPADPLLAGHPASWAGVLSSNRSPMHTDPQVPPSLSVAAPSSVTSPTLPQWLPVTPGTLTAPVPDRQNPVLPGGSSASWAIGAEEMPEVLHTARAPTAADTARASWTVAGGTAPSPVPSGLETLPGHARPLAGAVAEPPPVPVRAPGLPAASTPLLPTAWGATATGAPASLTTSTGPIASGSGVPAFPSQMSMPASPQAAGANPGTVPGTVDAPHPASTPPAPTTLAQRSAATALPAGTVVLATTASVAPESAAAPLLMTQNALQLRSGLRDGKGDLTMRSVLAEGMTRRGNPASGLLSATATRLVTSSTQRSTAESLRPAFLPASGPLASPAVAGAGAGTAFLAPALPVDATGRAIEGSGMLSRVDSPAGLSTAAGSRLFVDLAALSSPPGPVPGSSVAADGSSTLANRFGAAMAQQVMGQIASGQWQARIAVHPANLGPIDMRLELREGVLDVEFRAQHGMTRELLQDGFTRLREALEQSGVAVGRLTSDGPGQDGRRGPGEERRDGASADAEAALTAAETRSDSQAPVASGTAGKPEGLDILV